MKVDYILNLKGHSAVSFLSIYYIIKFIAITKSPPIIKETVLNPALIVVFILLSYIKFFTLKVSFGNDPTVAIVKTKDIPMGGQYL